MSTLILIIHIITCILIVFFVLLQPGDGGGSVFGGGGGGGGGGGSVFGGAGPVPFLSKMTGWAGAVFFATSLILTQMESKVSDSIVDSLPIPEAAPIAISEPTAAALPATASELDAVESEYEFENTGGEE